MKTKTLVLLLLFFRSIFVHAQIETNENGYNKFFYDTGELASEGNFKNGKPDGYWKNYYKSEGLKSDGFRKNNLLDSTWNFYNSQGVLLKQITYKNNAYLHVESTNTHR